jgi:two-component system nitrate/nitrite response regulator NarL
MTMLEIENNWQTPTTSQWSNPNPSPTLRVGIRTQDPLVRAGLASLLSARRGVSAVDDGQADVVLWDGIGTLEEGGAPVVALAGDPDQARGAWLAGARGMVHRDAAPERLEAALSAARAGLVAVDPEFAGSVAGGPQLSSEGYEPLTERESEVLELLAEGLSNKDIGLALGVTAHTAKFHVAAILNKLGAATRTEAVVRAARLGWLAI